MRALITVAFLLGGALRAQPGMAACQCRCVDGQMQALCTNPVEQPPVCPANACLMPPVRDAHVDPPMVPPPGTSLCRTAQVLNPATNRYEIKRICE